MDSQKTKSLLTIHKKTADFSPSSNGFNQIIKKGQNNKKSKKTTVLRLNSHK
jgi:hypothetical protein